MQDAESANPVCGDVYAKAFMNEEGLQILESFKGEAGPNASNVARRRGTAGRVIIPAAVVHAVVSLW